MENDINTVIPYFNIYAADFKVFKDKLTPEEIIIVLNAICDICLFGDSDFNSDNTIQMLFFNKLKETLLKNIIKYKTSVENGKKGGRPIKEKTQQKPTGFLQVNLNHNPEHNLNKTQTETIKENKRKDNIKDIYIYLGEFKNIQLTDEQISNLKNVYGDKFDEAIETLSSYIESSGKKYKSHYAVLGEHNWVYKALFIPKTEENRQNGEGEYSYV